MRSLVLAAALLLPVFVQAQGKLTDDLAPAPPMGWNSWDAYGTTISEKSFRQNAAWIAQHLKPFGYQYVTIDEAWYDAMPTPDNHDEHLVLDAYGRFVPAVDRFPSAANGAGFGPLADYIHSLGLKFGIHVLQGIPKKAVEGNDPILASDGSGTSGAGAGGFHARDAANTHASCQWDTKTWDLQDNDAGQAYYDSIVRLYASWHVDLIKIDCIASRPYKGEEIRMFHEAIRRSGAPIVLSLSPGAAPLDEAANLAAYSQQWRISDDIWDVWQATGPFPQGVNDQIGRAAKWLPFAGPGHWPDLDMLPLGELRPSPGWGEPRTSRLTPDEQRSMMNLWCIVRSPLVYGGDPVATNAATLALLTNPELLEIDQHARAGKNPLLNEKEAVYTAQPASGPGLYVAVFNRSDAPLDTSFSWSTIGLPARFYRIRDLWTHADEAAQAELKVKLAPHASTMLLIKP